MHANSPDMVDAYRTQGNKVSPVPTHLQPTQHSVHQTSYHFNVLRILMITTHTHTHTHMHVHASHFIFRVNLSGVIAALIEYSFSICSGLVQHIISGQARSHFFFNIIILDHVFLIRPVTAVFSYTGQIWV